MKFMFSRDRTIAVNAELVTMFSVAEDLDQDAATPVWDVLATVGGREIKMARFPADSKDMAIAHVKSLVEEAFAG